MPIASPEVYAEMLDRAKAGQFAYPAINCTSSQTIVAALRGFAEAESDGIIQFSFGGAEFASGQTVKSMVAGAEALAEFAHSIARSYGVNIALHTDHCAKEKLAGYVEPLLKLSQERVAAGKDPLFQSHMWDGSAVPLDENLEIAQRLLDESVKANIILEIEIGVVGGDTECRGEQPDHSLVGLSLLGRRRHLDLQGVAEPTHDLVPRGAWHHLDLETGGLGPWVIHHRHPAIP